MAGMKDSVAAWMRLVRIDHGLMSAVGVLIGMLVMMKVSGGTVSPSNFAFALFVPLYVQIAAFALNDYLDVETDRHNKRKDRPLVSGEISVDVARNTALFGFVLGVFFAFLINPLCGGIALVFSALSVAYDYKLKDMALVGNAYIALSMAIAFVFGAAVVKPDLFAVPSAVWLVCAIAVFAGFGREIVKTTQDMEGDKEKRNAKTLPIMIGARKSLLLAAASYVLFAASSLWLVYSAALPFMVLSAGLVVIAVLAFLAMAYEMLVVEEISSERLAAFRKASLLALAVGLLGILIAAI